MPINYIEEPLRILPFARRRQHQARKHISGIMVAMADAYNALDSIGPFSGSGNSSRRLPTGGRRGTQLPLIEDDSRSA